MNCVNCHKTMMHDGALTWCPQCAWEPPESRAVPALVANDSLDEYCPRCEGRFADEDRLMLHLLLVHHDHRLSPCPQCGEPYRSGRPLEGHMRVRHSPIPHGTTAGYSRGCRCAPCNDAMSNYYRARRRRRRMQGGFA